MGFMRPLHKLSIFHKAFSVILYNIPYCKR